MSKTNPKRRELIKNQLNTPAGVKLWEDGKVSVVDENKEKGECTIHLIFCPNCQKRSGKKVVVGGFNWAINPFNLYGSMSFIKLNYVCSTCGTETPLPKQDLAIINKYSSDNIDKCHFPANTRTAIKNQVNEITGFNC